MNLKLRSAFCVLYYEELVDVYILMVQSPTQINPTKYLIDKMPQNPLHCQAVVQGLGTIISISVLGTFKSNSELWSFFRHNM